MGIYIKGMSMPTSCDGSCPLYDREFLRCNITYTEPWWGHDGEPIEVPIPIPTDCPLIPVPPHGDLIDRDALLRRIAFAETDQPEIADVYVDDYIIVSDWLRSAPTILEAEGEK